MKSDSPNQQQTSLFTTDLIDCLNPNNRLYQLAQRLPWAAIEKDFEGYYSKLGQPAKPIRLMVGLLMLKQLENLSDEVLVERWCENPYYQFFCGMATFQWEAPCHPTDLVYFRKRIGKEGAEKLLSYSLHIHPEAVRKVDQVLIDTTVQEKNITYPTDAKLAVRVIDKCRKIASKEGIQLRQSYRRVVKSHLLNQRFATHPKNRKKARSSLRSLKTIAGRLIRELRRKLPTGSLAYHRNVLKRFERVIKQQRTDKNKIYSLHEPDVACIIKGKVAKKYEFGSKASLALTKESNLIVGVASFKGNPHDSHTLEETLNAVERASGQRPKEGICDRGYRGKARVGSTQISIPKAKKHRNNYQKQKTRKKFRRRAAIEPVIGHTKQGFRLERNYLKSFLGDEINLNLAAMAFNLKSWIRKQNTIFVHWLQRWIYTLMNAADANMRLLQG
ncbi:IS5 family transposase [Tunicatimonas pelagia]|uniref:IS5 family transposase n=1 Tax=Tunicatimonas pelagia TaxID=931531 RepID=UPI002665591B|nr:IS5 family transposase [Tunicatimonas pelagia]WKN42927.1 IS5 family transposase [Tunicatimonas pelagia]WKN43603.1 IS5 family transposase [Tunicatimonas pelagia]WKN44942.1 IS5 family transposase [Tunicatimonas pelagia]